LYNFLQVRPHWEHRSGRIDGKAALEDHFFKHYGSQFNDVRPAEEVAAEIDDMAHEKANNFRFQVGPDGKTLPSKSRIWLKTEVHTKEELRELHRNMSMLLHSWLPQANISEELVDNYWRGEHEWHVAEERDKVIQDWENDLVNARKTAKSFKVLFKFF
jgi:hypothetical protein